jgi:hypothetical protein
MIYIISRCVASKVISGPERPRRSYDGTTSPRNTAALRRANSANVVGRMPNAICVSGCTTPSPVAPFLRSLACTSSASAIQEGTPAASSARVLSAGGTLTYRTKGKGELFGNLRHAQCFWPRHLVAFTLVP